MCILRRNPHILFLCARVCVVICINLAVETLRGFSDDFSQPIGKGSQGVVYKGIIRDTRLEIDFKVCSGGGGKERKIWQVLYFATLNHPNVVRLIGFAEDVDGDRLFLVYPFYNGGSLQDKLQGHFLVCNLY